MNREDLTAKRSGKVAVESGVVSEGSFDQTLDGRHYNRGVRLHKIMYEAFSQKILDGFHNWVQENHHEKGADLVLSLEKVGKQIGSASMQKNP